MRKAVLNPKAFKIVKYIIIVGLILILIFPLIHLQNIASWINGAVLLISGDWLCTFLQHHSINVTVGLIIGYTLSVIISALLFFYIYTI